MIVEKSLKRAKLTGQAGMTDDNLALEVIPHPSISGCCILIISEKDLTRASITVNNSELKKVADMLCGGVVT